MFLTPAGNPSSLRFGHPDVATEHTDFSPSPGRWSSGCGCAVWNEPRALGLGRVCGNGEGEYWGEVPQTARRGRQIGIWVPWWFRRDVRVPSRGLLARRAQRNHARTAQLYLPEATSGCPSSARAGAPVGAKEVYSAPVYPLHERGTHPARHLTTLEGCSTHHTVVLT